MQMVRATFCSQPVAGRLHSDSAESVLGTKCLVLAVDIRDICIYCCGLFNKSVQLGLPTYTFIWSRYLSPPCVACPTGDSNPHAHTGTATSTLRVCQFRQSDLLVLLVFLPRTLFTAFHDVLLNSSVLFAATNWTAPHPCLPHFNHAPQRGLEPR